MPAVSVIIPVYNGAATLRRTIDSVLAQTRGDFEIVVVDDGSTDDSAAVAAACGEPRVRIIRREHGGLSAARNTGIHAAGGQHLAFLDADDEWEPDFLGKTLALLEARPAAGGVYTLCRYIDEASNLLPQPGSLPVPDAEFHERLYDGCFLPVHTAVLRRGAVWLTGDFDPDLTAVEDWDYWIRFSARFNMIALPEPLARYRVSPGSMSASAERMRLNRLRVLRKHVGDDRLEEAGLTRRGRRAYGRAYLAAAAEFMAEGRADEGWRMLARAAARDPLVLYSIDTYYALAVSGQPKGFRGTRAGLDPQGTARALRKGIDRMFAQHPALADQRRDALHYAHLALWTLFDRTVYWSLARTHLILAAAYRPAMALEARRWRTLARLTLGPALTRVWRARTRQEAS